MIKKLTASNETELDELLKKEALLNLFILGDIENFGYDNEIIDIWGDYDADGRLRACLLRFERNFLPYSLTDEFDAAGFAEIIQTHENYAISGIPRATVPLEAYIPSLSEKCHKSYFIKCENASMINANREVIIRSAKQEDVAEIVELRQHIKEFGNRIENEELITTQLDQGSKRIYYIEQDGKIVSVAESTAENSFSAMIVGVATLEEYRGRGFASTIMKRLCCDLLAEGKTPCLFYDNPIAGKIYHKIGFTDVGDYMLYR
ncbi:GNAT family acetyltransferase [Listeria floridensis FSL S10-1187]|uniref:GNAT family acetyltransferase n=1 Tax=Listeria floridensis FSL S10-1187 TaxID=1265817 RepID=A0ABN0RBG1_9LIST|nr:GNAT family acetyltransferase [Listeria floridensis FSL S10-1187]